MVWLRIVFLQKHRRYIYTFYETRFTTLQGSLVNCRRGNLLHTSITKFFVVQMWPSSHMSSSVIKSICRLYKCVIGLRTIVCVIVLPYFNTYQTKNREYICVAIDGQFDILLTLFRTGIQDHIDDIVIVLTNHFWSYRLQPPAF